MTILMSNTYKVEKNWETKHMVTGVIGVFSTREKAMVEWNNALKNQLGVPEDELKDYQPDDILGRCIVPVDQNGKYQLDEHPEWIIELMSKDTELDKVLNPGD